MKKIAVILLFWITSLLISALIAPNFIQETLFTGFRNNFGERFPRLIWMWANLDGSHYLSIARDGYYRFEHGFFPLYPIIIRTLTRITGFPYLLSALLITYSSFLLFLYILNKLLSLDFKKDDIIQTILWLVTLPASFYLLAVYNDSTFLFLAVTCFYMARKQKWWFAGIAGGLAALMRFAGVALFPALLVEWWLGKRKRRNLIPLFLIPLATLNYFLYIHISRGSWRLFMASMNLWQQDQFVLPFQTAFRYFKIFATVTPNSLMYLVALTEFAAVVFAIVVLIKGFKLIRLSYWIYAVSYLLIPMSGGTFQGEPRYIIHAFPVILIFSQLMAKNRWRYLVMGGLFILQLIFMAFFSRGYFIS
jgi:Gpi18-like mannosyltransferase